ncbi:TlpA disulfide reductase family protein [Nannocystis sp. RBIL2]|uniref:TlpA family protein disulfide reductase n=1 Tax=Nannocystis sp. RBIL2 TaxID=2996788 RepID=UPI002271C01C|nr:TlpA disulfide reductase family protein [Nannocystis sp. RBIL2]MCY1066163.1 TlpA disulfide reductase family protein [Nannocystis sp. RBIL2]
MTRLRTALARWGGALLRPRATVASLAPEDGPRDGLLFILLFAAGAHLLALGDAAADFAAMAGLAALPTLLAGFTVLIPWLVTTLAVEAILGPLRAHRAALCMLPMLLVVVAARLAAGLGHPLPVPKYSIEIAGAVLAAGLALWIRPTVCLSRETAKPAPPAGRAALVVGALVVLLPLASAGRDAADLAAHWQTLAPVAVGEAVPEFHAEDLDGGDFTTADLRGGARLLVFFTSWCGVCSDEMSKYVAVHHELAERGFAVVGVNCDREGDQRAIAARYRDDKQLPFRIVLDRGAISRAFRLSVYPHLVLVDAHGRIRWVHQGRALDSTLRAAITAATSPDP